MMTMFFAGLSGGVSHCVGMCGPFVMMQVSKKMDNVAVEKINMFTRLKGAALLPYHMGRATTYILIGVFSAFLMSNIAEFAIFRWVSFSLLMVAALIMLLSIFNKSSILFSGQNISNKISNNIFRKILSKLQFKFNKNTKFSFIKKLFKNPIGFNGYFLGILLGFIPCALVYSAIMVVSSTGNVAVAAIGMAVFSISTIPGLILTGLGASFAPAKQPVIGKYIVPLFMVLSFLTLIYTAGGLLK